MRKDLDYTNLVILNKTPKTSVENKSQQEEPKFFNRNMLISKKHFLSERLEYCIKVMSCYGER